MVQNDVVQDNELLKKKRNDATNIPLAAAAGDRGLAGGPSRGRLTHLLALIHAGAVLVEAAVPCSSLHGAGPSANTHTTCSSLRFDAL